MYSYMQTSNKQRGRPRGFFTRKRRVLMWFSLLIGSLALQPTMWLGPEIREPVASWSGGWMLYCPKGNHPNDFEIMDEHAYSSATWDSEDRIFAQFWASCSESRVHSSDVIRFVAPAMISRVGYEFNCSFTVRDLRLGWIDMGVIDPELLEPRSLLDRVESEFAISEEMTPEMRDYFFERGQLTSGSVIDMPRYIAATLLGVCEVIPFFALIIELLVFLVVDAERDGRYYRYQCVDCGYQLSKDDESCPECNLEINHEKYKTGGNYLGPQ